MPKEITGYRVFIASPGGLSLERRRFRSTLAEYNDTEALARGITFLPIGWEDTLSGVGRPQSLINDDVKISDYFVLVLWDRWGTPTSAGPGGYTSGTEEEYHLARQCLAASDAPLRRVVILFKGVDERQLSDPGEQLRRVMAFRRQIESEKALLYQTFDSEDEFERILRKHLAQWVRDHESGKVPVVAPPASVVPEVPAAATEDSSSAKSYDSLNELLKEAERLAGLGQGVDAETLFARAIVGSRSVQARLKYGRFLRRSDRLAHAKVIYQSALDLAVEDKQPRYAAEALANLGIIARHLRNLEEAEHLLHRAQETIALVSDPDPGLQSFIIGNMAQVQTDKGDLDKAEQTQRQALALQSTAGREEDVANGYGVLAVILRRQRRLEEAESAHREGIRLSESLGTQGARALAYNCGSLGLLLERLGRLDEATELQRRALDIHQQLNRDEGEAVNRSHLASALVGLGQLDEAAEHNEAAAAINNRRRNTEGLAYNCSTRGRIQQAKGNHSAAIDNYRMAVSIFRNRGNEGGLAFNLDRLADALWESGDHDEALTTLKHAEDAAAAAGETDLLALIRKKLSATRA